MSFKDPKRRKEYNRGYQRTWIKGDTLGAINKRKYRVKYIEKWQKEHPKLVKKYNKNWYNRNRTDQLKKRKVKDAQLKLKVLLHYSKGVVWPSCECCGETCIEFLSIDHINNDGAKHRKEVKSSVHIYRWLLKNKFPEGFRVLCINCNFALGHFGYCPHKSEQHGLLMP